MRVHANQISVWKKQLLGAGPDIFTLGKDKETKKKKVERDRLYKNLGRRLMIKEIPAVFYPS
jgi:hypothetical protein